MLFVRKKLNRISRTVNLELLEISSLKKRMQGDVSGIDPDDIDAVIIEGKKMSKEEYFKNKNALKEIEELRKKCVGWWAIREDNMNKKVTLIIIIVLFAIVLGLIIYPVAMNSKVEQLTREYITDVGYDNEDIKEIKIGHSYINKLLGYNEWRISVEFNKLSNKFDENIKASFWFSYREDKIFFEGTNLEPISEDKGLVIKYMDSFKDGTLLDNENFPIEERIDPEDETKKELCIETVFRGIVKRIEEESIILEPEGNEVKFICAIPIKNMPASPEPVVGDIVEVVYDGSIEETHPAKLGNLGNIQTVRVIREEISGDSLAPVEE